MYVNTKYLVSITSPICFAKSKFDDQVVGSREILLIQCFSPMNPPYIHNDWFYYIIYLYTPLI